VLQRPEYRDFKLWLPSGPGLGVEIDEHQLTRLRRH
jgi:muconate cycloisomerase